jgi:hypothetical protein
MATPIVLYNIHSNTLLLTRTGILSKGTPLRLKDNISQNEGTLHFREGTPLHSFKNKVNRGKTIR